MWGEVKYKLRRGSSLWRWAVCVSLWLKVSCTFATFMQDMNLLCHPKDTEISLFHNVKSLTTWLCSCCFFFCFVFFSETARRHRIQNHNAGVLHSCGEDDEGGWGPETWLRDRKHGYKAASEKSTCFAWDVHPERECTAALCEPDAISQRSRQLVVKSLAAPWENSLLAYTCSQ